MKKLIILTLFVTYAFAAPFPQDDDKDDDLSFDDLNDAVGTTVEEPKTEVPKKIETYIQKIPRKNHIKDGEELEKCLTKDPAKGHPHLVKTDVLDVAEVLIAHSKTEPEHVHKFADLPADAQKDIVVEVKYDDATTTTTTTTTTSTTTEAATTTTTTAPPTTAAAPEPPIPTPEPEAEPPKFKLLDLERRKRESERPTKVRLPKLKKKPVADLPKPEPITIKLHEVAGFDKIKTKTKRDTDAVRVKRFTFQRPKPVSEIFKPRPPPSEEDKKDEEHQDDQYDDYEESLPIEGRKEPPKFGKDRKAKTFSS